MSVLSVAAASKNSIQVKELGSMVHNLEEGSQDMAAEAEHFFLMLSACDEVTVSGSQNCALVFVAGYIALKICDKIDCEGCISGLKTVMLLDMQSGNTSEDESRT